MELINSNGKTVSKKQKDDRLKIWTDKETEKWNAEQLKTRWRNREFVITPLEYAQVRVLELPQFFQINQPGEFTLHLKMRLVESQLTTTQKPSFKTTWLPEVTAKVQVSPEDIARAKAIQK